MYKTSWLITDENNTGVFKNEITVYHFSKNPKFPNWYMKENHVYKIEMIWNIKLIKKFDIFMKCLTHKCTAKRFK